MACDLTALPATVDVYLWVGRC